MKILHVASFQGNIGDNASHIGFYNILDRIVKHYKVEQLEIRKFYKNYNQSDKKIFDKTFIDYLNGFELCIIGGGSYLDYWVPNSQTGTYIDIDPILLSQIQTKTLFASIGCNPHKEIPKGNIEKFRFFLYEANKNRNIKIVVRNDGSVESIKKDIGEKYLENIEEILDHGFFYQDNTTYPKVIEKKYVAINIVNDQLWMQSKIRGAIDKKKYLGELKKVVEYCINNMGYDLVFVPHIYSDLKAISELLEIIDDSMIRGRITIAPCIQRDEGARYIFSIYKNSEWVIGTRLHANVCSIAMGKKTIGLAVLDRIEYMYRTLGIEDRVVVLDGEFSEQVIDILKQNIKNVANNELLNKLQNKVVQLYEKIIRELK
jgi:polysaccharide pyruvyl transferase WcaK-like protein